MIKLKSLSANYLVYAGLGVIGQRKIKSDK